MKRTEASSHTKRQCFGKQGWGVFGLSGLLLLATPTFAAKSLDDAVRNASNNGTRQVISAQTVQKKSKQTHVVRVLTNKGKVKTLRYPGGQQHNSPPRQTQKSTKKPKG